jgi:PKD repeat protein
MRALLALLVLLGMLPVQGGGGADAGRAQSGPVVLHLDVSGGELNLSLQAPATNGSVVMGRGGSANFTVAGLSGLYRDAADWFTVDLALVSLNVSGLELSCRLDLDYLGNGSDTRTLAYRNFTTTKVIEAERALILPAPSGHDGYAGDLRNGSLRLEIARIDASDGLLEVLCGAGGNSSTLSIPFGAPLSPDAGPDRAARTGRTVAFNASLSDSVDPDATLYLWTFGNGMTAAGTEVETVYNEAGTFNVTLTMRWNGLESSDTAVVAVSANRPPTADAGLNVTKRAGENMTFRGAGSDPDGDPVSFSWSFGDGTNASGRNVTHYYTQPGDYTVVLTVRDDSGAVGQDEVAVHINLPPVITNITATRNGAEWRFQAAALDPDGTILRYNWTFGDGSGSNSTQPSHTYTSTGNFTVVCRITDEYGDSATLARNITVTNAPPVVTSLGLSASGFGVNSPVRFRPQATDPDNDRLSFDWNFGDGTTSQDRNPTHYYAKAGTFTVTLRVSDGNAVTTVSSTLTISDSPPGDESLLWSLLPCILIIITLVIVTIARSAAQARKRQEQGLFGGPEAQPYGGLPQTTQPYAGGQYPTYGAPRYQTYGAPGYPAAPAPARASRPSKAPPGVCPRCGSTDHVRYPDGHAKCVNCKKIFFTG